MGGPGGGGGDTGVAGVHAGHAGSGKPQFGNLHQPADSFVQPSLAVSRSMAPPTIRKCTSSAAGPTVPWLSVLPHLW